MVYLFNRLVLMRSPPIVPLFLQHEHVRANGETVAAAIGRQHDAQPKRKKGLPKMIGVGG